MRSALDGKDVNIIFTDARGIEKRLTSSGVNTEPSLSRDKSAVVFLHKPNENVTEIWTIQTDGSALTLFYRGPFQWHGKSYPSSAIHFPQWALDGRSVYFVTDFTLMTGALWKLDMATRKVSPIIPEAVMCGVLQAGPHAGFLIANQRSLSNVDSDGQRYPGYPFFLFTADGKRVQEVADETGDDDMEGLLKEWEGRR